MIKKGQPMIGKEILEGPEARYQILLVIMHLRLVVMDGMSLRIILDRNSGRPVLEAKILLKKTFLKILEGKKQLQQLIPPIRMDLQLTSM